MAKPNYNYQKRQKELAKIKKREAKRLKKKLEKENARLGDAPDALGDVGVAQPADAPDSAESSEALAKEDEAQLPVAPNTPADAQPTDAPDSAESSEALAKEDGERAE